MRIMKLITLFIGLFLFPIIVFAQNISDYLIVQDIGVYKLGARQKVVGGFIGGPRIFDGAGVIAPTAHFYVDHTDKTYEVYYEGGNSLNSPTVQVTQHAGADSDKWLLHEVEDSYRDGDLETLGLLTDGAVLRRIDSKRIFWIGIGGGSFMWVSNNLVIKVSYTDLQGTKPEPLEVVQAYLQKFPSTIALTDAEIKSRVHNETWIKDEMERRLWLCDKWNAQFQLGKVTQADMLKQLADHMTVFLKYRQRYYGIDATDDINALFDYSRNKDAAAIMNKLTAYKAWWAANKGNAISL